MLAIDTSAISNDLERIAVRVEDGHDLGADFCDRLTRSLAQLFGLADAACSDDDRHSFDRILIRIAPGATIDARAFLSDRLSDSTTPPRGILLHLANDVVDVARPLLQRSPALGEDDLIDIARARGPGHMEAMADRHDLTIRITDILVLRGDDTVRRTVAGNHHAPFSDKSFARMSLQARNDTAVEAHLIRRNDLPDLVVRFLVENGSPAGRSALAARSRPADTHLHLDFGALPVRAAEDGWLEIYDFDGAERVLDRLPEVRNHVDGFLRRLAQSDQFPEIVQVMAAITDIRLETMKHVLVTLDTEPFAVIARALSLKTDTVREMLGTGPWLHRLDARSREATLALFRAIDPDTARAKLRRWVEHETSAVAFARRR